MRDAVAQLAVEARNAARMMVRPAATGFVENRIFFAEAYMALQCALDAYEEALSVPEEKGEEFVCHCLESPRDALGICHQCGGFSDES